MTFEQFERVSRAELEASAAECFTKYETAGGLDKPAYLLEAQIYMRELDKRHDSKIARRDLILEVIVILLILGELVLGAWGIAIARTEGKEQARLLGQQKDILTNLQKSSSDTASAMSDLATLTKAMSDNASASAKTLLSLRATTETMNKGVHEQISLFYDPAMTIAYSSEQNRIQFANTGRTSLKVMSVKIAGDQMILPPINLVAAGTTLYLDNSERYKKATSEMPKDSTFTAPVEAHLENEIGKHFILNGALFFVWQNDKITVHGQTTSLQPEP